jgi:hypothetical protein
MTSYHAVHMRLRRAFGPAKDRACAKCGAPAHHWAFDQAGGLPYSEDLSRYRPLCRSCHLSEDLRRERCPRGHELTADNIRPGRHKRQCWTCHRDYMTEHNDLLRQARELLGMTKRAYVRSYGTSKATATKIIEERTP